MASVLVAAAWLFACEVEREPTPGVGVHPVGWADPDSAAFHGSFLAENGYPLAECQQCHGSDYRGGDVGISCEDSGCHTQGVDHCEGTCHGNDSSALPATPAHPAHQAYCSECHPLPDGIDLELHISGVVDFDFQGLARAGGQEPRWDATSRRCTNTYCHQVDSPVWEDPTPLGCDSCHDTQASHAQFARVVREDTCAGCHAGSPEVGHLNGELAISVKRCDACHGSGATSGAPPPDLDGSTSPSSVGVGTHRSHLDSLLPGRIGKVAPCTSCHPVPGEVLSPGHLDQESPADVDVVLGTYDFSVRSCVVSCHFDREPGPVWTDDSGAELACDACHEFPPDLTRKGTRHPPSEPLLSICVQCHAFSPVTHVDGVVTFL